MADLREWLNMSGALQATFMNQRGFIVTGQQAYTTAGTFTWVAPAGVTKVSTVAVGGGRGGGGALAYGNNLTVVPGCSYSLTVGVGGVPYCSVSGLSKVCISGAGTAGGGGTTIAGVRSGGTGGNDGGTAGGYGSGGGGAGGYSGLGGVGVRNGPGTAGAGGAGGGGGGGLTLNCFTSNTYTGGGGGGVGILGEGASGAAGTISGATGFGGGGGSGGATGASASGYVGAAGGLYGGGAGVAELFTNFNFCCGYYNCASYTSGTGARGAVRIIWPGCARSFPSTRTADE